MNTFKIIAVAATMLVASSAAAFADPADAMGGIDALDALSSANYATVETVSPTDAKFLMIDTDSSALQHRVMDNKAVAASLSAQGYAPSDVVGISGNGNNVTLYVL